MHVAWHRRKEGSERWIRGQRLALLSLPGNRLAIEIDREWHASRNGALFVGERNLLLENVQQRQRFAVQCRDLGRKGAGSVDDDVGRDRLDRAVDRKVDREPCAVLDRGYAALHEASAKLTDLLEHVLAH